jgi:uncharacterized protein
MPPMAGRAKNSRRRAERPAVMAAAPPTSPTQSIDAYGGGGFRIGGQAYRGSILVLPESVEPWPVADIAELTVDSLSPVAAASAGIELLLIGCGARIALIPPALRQAMREKGVVIDAMDTGAACRTYNVLRGEGRQVAAALIAVG